MIASNEMQFLPKKKPHEFKKSSVADLGEGGTGDAPLSKFLQFHAFFWKIWQNRILVTPPVPTPGRVGTPPRGNPGIASDYSSN